MNRTLPLKYICRSCRSQIHQKREASTLTSTALDNGFARLKSRKLLALYGLDAAHFLQGLTTQNIPTSGLLSSPSRPQVLYSAFMNAQGRLLHDIFIYPLNPQHALRDHVLGTQEGSSTPAFLLEVDSTQVKALHAFLRKYKLRAKVTIRAVDEQELGIYSAWTEGGGKNSIARSLKDDMAVSSLLVASDPRVPKPWHRVLATSTNIGRFSESTELSQVDESIYKVKRYLQGVPEGQRELPREETLLHEANVDLMQGVDFRKGCYVGQELVIRTQHTGVVRKRVMPVQIWTGEQPDGTSLEQDEPDFSAQVDSNSGQLAVAQDSPLDPLMGQNIKTKGAKRPEGRFLAGIGNIGLGLCRLERVIELEDGLAKGRTQLFEVDTENSVKPMDRTWVRPFIPTWWQERGQVMEGGYESLKALSPGRKS